MVDVDILIVKYLSGESTREEADEINMWRKSAPENELYFRQSEEAWYLVCADRIHIRPDKGKTWQRIQDKISRRYSLPFLVRVAGVAASVALVMSLALIHFYTGKLKSNIPEQSQKITLFVPGGVCSKTILPDSTIVWLNSSSTISYPSYFDGNTRTVELIGEAFFDVTRNEKKPFIIRSGDLQLKVLGTSFNFKHYKEDTHAVLAVETGAVILSSGTSVATTVQAGKYATVDNKSLKTKVYNTPSLNFSSSQKKTDDASSTMPRMIDRETHTDQFSSWRDYKMVFRDEPFSNVLNELSRRYNAEFEILGEEIKEYVYTANFCEMSLEDILSLLKLSAPIDFTIESLTSNTMNAYGKRKVTIYRK